MKERRDIVMLYGPTWDAPSQVSKHHLARHWASQGHRVLYVEAPFHVFSLVTRPREVLRLWRRYTDGPHEVEPNLWDNADNQWISESAGGKLMVRTRVKTHRKIAAFLRSLELEALKQAEICVWAYAFPTPNPDGLALGPDGSIADEVFERLQKKKGARRLGYLEFSAQAEQLVSAFSGKKHRVLAAHRDEGSRIVTVPDGLCVKLRMVPSGNRVQTKIRIAFTKLLGIDEVSTARGVVQMPRLVEVELDEERSLPDGKIVLLGRLGPLPEEAGLPRHVLLFARISSSPENP